MSEHLYYLRTLSAEGVLDQFCADVRMIDLTNSFTRDAVISSTGRYGESAMLYQILCQLEPDAKKRETLRKNRDALKDVVFFLDFGGIFLSGNDERKKAAEKLLREGLDLRLAKGAEPVRYTAFDKSNSMARAGRIAYLRADLPEKMHGRLMLDMRGFQANLSKVYAYRGLYFSDADRIESPDLVLNEKTVVVLPDDEDLIANAKDEAVPQTVFTAEADGKDDDSYDIWNPLTRDEEITLNRFDGEGLLTPAAAKAINAALGTEADNTSFQIRMPFAKGMLHQTDFHAFFASLLREGENPDDLWVADMFGKRRRLADCQILLTKSMFKCHKWLKKHCEREKIDDPMQYYFEKMREYGHALYISNTDEMLRDPSGRVELNYQFLNPLDLTDEAFSKLVENHFEYADRLERNRYYQRLQSEKPADPAAQDGDADDETLLRHEKAAWSRAVRKNPDFLWDRHVKKTLESLRQSVERDCTLGRLSVPGACRFLARDLLALLVFAAKKQLYLGNEKLFALAPDKIRAAQRECLAPDRFYLPGAFKLSWSEHCVLLRNPHLARNEECMLRPLVPNDRYGALYQQYFSGLTGVVMVPYDSLVPMALSGADFDGDLVKVVMDPSVTEAVRRGVYRQAEAAGKKTWERSLPVISIPAPAGPDSDVTAEIDVPTIRDTFSSRVGQISNMAIRFGKEEYGAEPPESIRNKCAECCILTGLEIDASKTGRHPSLRAMQKSMEALYKNRKNEKDTYLELKDRVHALRPGSWNVSGRTENSVRIWVKGARGFAVQQRGARLDQLLWRYLARIAPETPPKKTEKREEKPRLPLFRYEQQPTALNPNKEAAVQTILDAYSAVLRETARLSKARRRYQQSNYSGRCRTIILQQYSAMTDPIADYFPGRADSSAPDETVEIVLLRAWNALHEHFAGDADAVDAALRALVEKQWHFRTLPEREALLGELGLAKALSQNAVCMLTRFDCSGYRLLYYMLKDVRAVARREQDTEIEDESEPGTAEDNAAEPTADGDVVAAYRALVLPRLRENAETSVWKNELIDRCRNDLMRAVEALDMGDVLPYVYGRRVRCDPDGKIFWDLFRWEDLRDQIAPAEKKGEIVHAG